MEQARFVGEVQRLLSTDVAGLGHEGKVGLVRDQLALFEADRSLLELRIAFVPFAPGQRALDEAKHPGLGSSEAVGLFTDGGRDDIVFLYHITRGGRPVDTLPAGARILATIERLDESAGAVLVPGWDRKPLELCRLGDVAAPGELPHACVVGLSVSRELGVEPPGDDPSRPMGFGSAFFERFRMRLDLEVGGTPVSADTHDFECYNLGGFGTFYRRMMERLLPLDMAQQGHAAMSVAYHPWFPVLGIGTHKADLYMKAIVGDLIEQKRMLTDPAWLLRVGLYLELLTCLGIIEAVKDDVDLFTPRERELFETSPRLADVRRRIDVRAWKHVWSLKKIMLGDHTGSGPLAAPSLLQNLLKKKSATLAFLHAHHEDLKQAIDLAGPNLVNGQETWHRVFRDAERAVLSRSDSAFPELALLADPVRKFVLWHEQGRFLVPLPSLVTGILGDQDGLYPSACRQYRSSMNHVADWALERGLMEYTGAECVALGASLLESYLARDWTRLRRLQNRDGYEGTLEVRERMDEEAGLSDAELASSLERVSLFQVLTGEERLTLARLARPIQLGPYERIIVEGSRGSSLFVVHSGELEVIGKVHGEEAVLAHLGTGAVVGEVAFLTGQTRTATVRATHGAVVLEIAPSHLEPIARARPGIIDQLTDLMTLRRQSTDAPSRTSVLQTLSSAILGRPWLVSEANRPIGQG